MTGKESGNEGRKPIHCLPPSVHKPGSRRDALVSMSEERLKLGGSFKPPNSTAQPMRIQVDTGVASQPGAPKMIWRLRSNAPSGNVVL